MKNTFSVQIAALALAVGTTFAGGHKYGMAGCGLGSIVMGAKGSQVLAATTNGTFASQLFGITTGTSNCAEDGVAMVDMQKQYFAEANYESLKQEMAQGNGENLVAFAEIVGCKSDVFAKSMQSHYSEVFDANTQDAASLVNHVDQLVGNQSDLQAACSEVN